MDPLMPAGPMVVGKALTKGARDKDQEALARAQPRIDVTKKVFRYRPGRLPEYLKADAQPGPTGQPKVKSGESKTGRSTDESDESESDSSDSDERPADLLEVMVGVESSTAGLRKRKQAVPKQELVAEVLEYLSSEDESPAAEPLDQKQDSDEDMDLESGNEGESKRVARRRMRREEVDDDQAMDEALAELEEQDDSSSSSSEVEAVELPKPVFKGKEERQALRTVEEEEEARAKAAEEIKEQRLAERREDTKKIVSETVAEEIDKEEKERMKIELGLIDSDDEQNLPNDQVSDEEKAYEEWKIRELGRLKRDERLRKLREAEARDLKLELENAKKAKKAEQGRMKFMQKYYHKGAFFQNVVESGVEGAFEKDFNAPTGEDQIDKTLLPKAMRVRKGDFGRKGRSKHTHLVDVDTTDWTSPWAQKKPRAS